MESTFAGWWFEAAPLDPRAFAAKSTARHVPHIRVQAARTAQDAPAAPRVRMLPATPEDLLPLIFP